MASRWQPATSQHQASGTLLAPVPGASLGQEHFWCLLLFISPVPGAEGPGGPVLFHSWGFHVMLGRDASCLLSLAGAPVSLPPCSLVAPHLSLISRLFLMVFGNSLERPRRHSLTPSSPHCSAASETVSPLSQGHTQPEKQLPPSSRDLAPHLAVPWDCASHPGIIFSLSLEGKGTFGQQALQVA